jgi:hypothetical protein
MLTMKQKILNGLVVTLIALIAISVVGILVLDGVAQSIVQTKASQGLGVPVLVDSIHVGFFGKKSSIKGLVIENPESYRTEKTPNLLTMKQANVEFSVLQMFDESVEIQNVLAEEVVLDLQQDSGKSNIEIIVAHVATDESPKGDHPNPPFTINTLTIRDITVKASGKFTVIDSGSVTAHIPEIVLHNIGSDGDAEVATEAITNAVTHAIMEHISNHPAEGFSKLAFSGVTELINSLPVFHQIRLGDAIQEVTDTVGEGIDGVLGGIGDLFDGDQDN